jgi:hypothetical protein
MDVFTQAVPMPNGQEVRGGRHAGKPLSGMPLSTKMLVQVPLEHLWSDAQVLPQAPQLVGSDCVLRQTGMPPTTQVLKPGGHVVPPTQVPLNISAQPRTRCRTRRS